MPRRGIGYGTVEETEMSGEEKKTDDGLGGDIFDIASVPVPPTVSTKVVDDELKADAAFNFCFVGAGQGGGRIAHQFYQYGYRRVCAINTASADLDPLPLPDKAKLKIGEDWQSGTGGDVDACSAIAKKYREDIFNLMRDNFGEDFDQIFVTISAGGGTGAGSCETIIQAAHDLINTLELDDRMDSPQVGVIVALPKESDGPAAYASAYKTYSKLLELADTGVISPLITIDNRKIQSLYPDLPAGKFWGTANHSVCSIFHLLNLVAARESEYTSFDRTDYETLLKSGLMTFGAMPVQEYEGSKALANAIRHNLTKSALVGGVDISTGTVAGCVVVAGKDVLDEKLPEVHIDNGFSMLARMLKKGSAIRRGIYAGGSGGVTIYTLVGGLGSPTTWLEDLKRRGHAADIE